ncbi:MAG: hypothetical protein HY361_05165 [Candidatus Aenigmarchaeota archaeon]|nr:hypothetical protein [Candidatus Aenigmarchaeota archaeon]
MKPSHSLLLLVVVVSSLLIVNSIFAQKPGSCTPSACGKYIEGNSCQCDVLSLDPKYNDYCSNIQTVCPDVYAQAKGTVSQQIGPTPSGSCQGYCDKQVPSGCWCDSQCSTYGDCCSDYLSTCAGETTKKETIFPGAGKAELTVGKKASIYSGPVGVELYAVTLEKVSFDTATIKVENHVQNSEETLLVNVKANSIIAGLDVYVQSISSNGATLWIGAEFAPDQVITNKPNLYVSSFKVNANYEGIPDKKLKLVKKTGIYGTKKGWKDVIAIGPIGISGTKVDVYYEVDNEGKIQHTDEKYSYYQQIKSLDLSFIISTSEYPVYASFFTKLQKLSPFGWDTIETKEVEFLTDKDNTHTFQLNMGHLLIGDNKLRLVIDTTNKINEPNENDNVYEFEIPLKKAVW